MVKTFVERHPLVLALLLAAASFGIAVFSVATSQKPVVSDVREVAPADLALPTQSEQAFDIFWSTGNLFWVLVALLAVSLLAWVGWLREAGFDWPPQRRNAHLLAFPFSSASWPSPTE